LQLSYSGLQMHILMRYIHIYQTVCSLSFLNKYLFNKSPFIAISPVKVLLQDTENCYITL
jgi:hypothetical protein